MASIMGLFQRFVRLAFFLLISGMVSLSQQPAGLQTGGSCAMPVFSTVVNEPNNLTEQQEEWLGEMLAPQIQRAFNVIPDPQNDYLDKLGERILAQLPPGKVHYRFTIIDLPANDSFGIPGGRIYLSRRIIALVQNEDELAGLLAHEIGHIVTHQAAIDLSHSFQTVLGITQFGDQKDVVEKWNRLLDTYATKPEKYSSKREDAEQLIADRVALYAMARAGYQPSRFVEFFDRLAQTKGNRGSFWTDMFGKTSRDSKRLRELLRVSAPLAQNCIAPAPADASVRFVKWQNAVIGSKFAVAKEAIPGLITKTALNPPLRSDLHSIQYSPDGKYLVAQDDSSIYVMTGNPVTNLFTIDAPDSNTPQFTADSREIVFYDKELRVEKWDLEKARRVSAHQLALTHPCANTALSHSGELFACAPQESEPELIRVDTSAVIVKGKKPRDTSVHYGGVVVRSADGSVLPGTSRIKFSSDDRYVLLGSGSTSWAYDLKEQKEVDLPNKLKENLAYMFNFVSANEIAAFRFNTSHKPGVELLRLSFPSGEIVDNYGAGAPGEIVAPTKGNYLLFRTSGSVPLMVMDLQTKKIAMMLKKPAFDIYDNVFVDESASGEIGVFTIADKKYVGGVDLPSGRLDRAMASAFSADGKWLAVSSRTRGAFWKADTGERTALTRGFQGAWFDQDRLIAKFPKAFPGKGTDAAGVFKVSPSDGAMETLYAFEIPDNKIPYARIPSLFFWLRPIHDTWQAGDLLVKINQDENYKTGFRFLVEVFDVRTNKKLWQRTIDREAPQLTYSEPGKTVTLIVGDYTTMKEEAHDNPRLGAGLAALSDENRRKASYVVQVLDPTTGRSTGAVLVDTGNLSFKVRNAVTAGDTIMVTDTADRTLVYSLKTGLQTGRVFGYMQAVSADGSKMLVEYGRGEVDLYETATLQSLAHYTFPAPMVHAEFSADGKTMRILTADQAIYTVKATAAEAAPSVH
jgi:WD40 repeat protein